MRIRTDLIAVLWLALAASAAAIPYVPPPIQVRDAPIDRALANIVANKDLQPGESARLQGRLNLLAYMRNTEVFPYTVEDGRLVEAGSLPCNEAPQGMRGEPSPQKFSPEDRCARIDFAIGPRDEIPDNGKIASTPSLEARSRLSKAALNYAQALDFDPKDLRARLGYAFALDRLGQLSSARVQLRTIIKLGLPLLANPQSDWEEHAVLTEAMEHLAVIAKSRADKARVARLRARLEASRPMIYVTPMVVPLTNAPFAALVDTGSKTAFDFAGTGDKRAQGWLTRDAAWLVWDPRQRGAIKSGFDLIGAVTWAAFWRDGFQVLRALDDDRNGLLEGAELKGLALWHDANGDGVSDSGEVRPAAESITALATSGAGDPDLLIAPAGVRFKDGAMRPLYDWTPRGAAAKAAPNS